MIKKIFLSVLLTTTLGMQSNACDVCGCSLSGLYFGLVPNTPNHFAGLRYNRASFSALIDNDDYYFEDEYSNDTYNRLAFFGQFFLSEKIQLRYILPYLSNTMKGSHQTVRSSGIGDPVLMAYTPLFNTGSPAIQQAMHSLRVGAGVKLPLGEHDKRDQNELINRNFQLGSGSTDFLLSVLYTFRYRFLGLNMESSYKLNTTNRDQYRFGNQGNLSANAVFYLETSTFSILPYGGVHAEYAQAHKDHHIKQGNTGGHAWLGNLGVQVFRKSFAINLLYQKPVYQAFNTDHHVEIKGGARLSASLLYSFAFKQKTKAPKSTLKTNTHSKHNLGVE